MAKSKELLKLEEIFSEIPENKREICQKLMENAVFMSGELTKLSRYIKKNGCTEEYQNGENQRGKKKSSEVEVYNTMIKNYASVIKQLCDLIPGDGKAESDELLAYIKR